jgi:hypothetical protein
MRIDIKINTDLLLEGRFQFSLEVIHKFCYPAIVFVVLLAVGDEDVVIVSRNDIRHE